MTDLTACRTIGDLLAAQAAAISGATAILAPGRLPLTYGRLARQVADGVATLHARGIGREDRVAAVLPNGPDLAVAFLTLSSTASCAPLSDALPADSYAYYLENLHPRALVLSADYEGPAGDVADALGLPVLTLTPDRLAGAFLLDGPSVPGSPHAPETEPEGDDVALVLHTSGTTTHPKLVPLTHANLLASAHHHVTALELDAGDCCLNVMPLTHVHGLVSVLLSSLWAGASVYCSPFFDAERFFDAVDEALPTWYTASPAIHQAVLACAAAHPGRVSRTAFRFIRSAAAPLPTPVMEALEHTFGVPVIESYGMTEAAAQITSNPLPPGRCVPGSVGRAAGPEVAVMDTEGTLLPVGDPGEVVIRGTNVMHGYAAPADANTGVFVDGWFRTGDLGILDEEGYLYLQGRLTEIINRGGRKISPRAVDDALLAHPSVADAATFSVPHRTLGEDVVAAVVLKPGLETGPNAIRASLFSRLPEYMVPSRVLVVVSFPKAETGKPQRRELPTHLADTLHPPYVPPRDAAEKYLAHAWSILLDVPEPGVLDNFFSLGGDSLTGMRLINLLRDDIGVELPTTGPFFHPVLEDQALWLLRHLGDGVLPPV